LTAARQTLVAARLDLALALLDLRFETGTLLTPPLTPPGSPPGAEVPLGGYRVRREDLTTVPVLDR
jgi:hypothetical protein